jgi:DNA-binding transcriptional MocR family regulator
MRPIPRQFQPEQVAVHLREGIERGRWTAPFPGVPQLAGERDVGRHTVRHALRILEAEGLLGGRGQGRSRGITAAGAAAASQRPLRVNILRHDARLADNPQTSMVLIDIMHSLEAAGHQVSGRTQGTRHSNRRLQPAGMGGNSRGLQPPDGKSVQNHSTHRVDY